jgi:hypothetical protein
MVAAKSVPEKFRYACRRSRLDDGIFGTEHMISSYLRQTDQNSERSFILQLKSG